MLPQYNDTTRQESRKRRIDKQKALGIALVAVGIVTLWLLPECADFGLLAVFLGIARTITND